MTATRRRVPGAVVGTVVAIALVALLGVLVARHGGATPISSSARSAGDRFLDRYMDRDGRVVRRDQGGDTVSEGQAYAMLIALALDDRTRFDRAWSWSRRHLVERDGLMSWRWHAGRVVGPGPAADADLDAARALVLAGRRFHNVGYKRAGVRMARALLAEETVRGGRSLVLVAGPWARRAPYPIDPSYFSPRAYSDLGRATRDRRFAQLAQSSWTIVKRLTRGGRSLPSDWAALERSGSVHPAPAPGGGAPSGYGFDAVRVPARFATSCDPGDRQLAAAMWPLVRGGAGGTHPAALAGAAAAAFAAGDRAASDGLLGRAEALDRSAPTYYGAAWVALARIELGPDALGAC
jgi:endo-1,4-beta-D-glucanase Y